MAGSTTDSEHNQVLPLTVHAEWHSDDIMPRNGNLKTAYHLTEKDFQLTDAAEPPAFKARHTMCIPVKRNTLAPPPLPEITYPSLRIHVEVLEDQSRSLNFRIEGLQGKDVIVTVQNIYGVANDPEVADSHHYRLDGGIQVLKPDKVDVHTSPPVAAKPKVADSHPPPQFKGKLEKLRVGTLFAGLGCDIEVRKEEVAKFLDFAGPLRARLNENLLDFQVEIAYKPKNMVDTNDFAVLKGRSKNLVFLYRRKTIVFLPGVLGSRFEVQAKDGTKAAYPDYLFRAGRMECDSEGNPLLPAAKPELFECGLMKYAVEKLATAAAAGPLMFFGPEWWQRAWQLACAAGAKAGEMAPNWCVKVYDVFEQLHKARVKKLPRLPDLLLYEVRIFAYDWRCDLTESANTMFDRLLTLRHDLSLMPDSDDQIALFGHSTGGLIIRWLMTKLNLPNMVSHFFFCDVPFRGAPKALGVFLTGCDPPGGKPMVDIIDKNSMRNVASNMPILYHLAPSNSFPSPVAGGDWVHGTLTREEEKASLMSSAVETGIYFPRPAVKKAPWLYTECEALAEGCESWGKFVDELTVRMAAREAFTRVGGWYAAKFFYWAPQEILDRSLILQIEARLPELWKEFSAGKMTGRRFIEAWIEQTEPWNKKLADNARVFHEKSEDAARSGAWAEKAYIFYSNTKDGKKKPTTNKIKITGPPRGEPLGHSHPGFPDGGWDWVDRLPPGPSDDQKGRTVEQWADLGRVYGKYKWLLSAETTAGDSTVPISSQLGFGGKANVFQPLIKGPEHTDAPNSDWLCERVIDVLLGENVKRYLTNADTKNGLELP